MMITLLLIKINRDERDRWKMKESRVQKQWTMEMGGMKGDAISDKKTVHVIHHRIAARTPNRPPLLIKSTHGCFVPTFRTPSIFPGFKRFFKIFSSNLGTTMDRTSLVRFVMDLLYNNLYNESTKKSITSNKRILLVEKLPFSFLHPTTKN